MTPLDETLLAEIEAAREELIGFLRGFVRIPTPNPPGDTRDAAAYLRGFLDRHGLRHEVIAPVAEWPNIVAAFGGARPGRHLVLNGHIDVFPAGEDSRWRHGSP